ncbi:MAG: hypothetical protein OXL37_10910 [Chloroflexota bacterium]|nr:hypothetical protein [Chloroflexota bacterium]MDE2959466.1 hypothetical protein [Chloroflexota bacterium]
MAATVAVVFALGLMALFVLPRPAHACLCAPSGSPTEALAEADAVFAGEVVAIRALGHPPYRLSSADPVAVEFRVSRVWKGPRRETITIETEASGISCGYQFKKERRYIVYAREGKTGMCTRTAPAWMAFADFVALGPGQPPELTPAADTGGGGACAAAADADDKPMDVAALALLAGVAALGIRRRPRL